jgi:hypothetical protein
MHFKGDKHSSVVEFIQLLSNSFYKKNLKNLMYLFFEISKLPKLQIPSPLHLLGHNSIRISLSHGSLIKFDGFVNIISIIKSINICMCKLIIVVFPLFY